MGLWRVELAVFTANMWAEGMKVTLAGTSFPIGTYLINNVDSVGKYLFIVTPYWHHDYKQTVAGGTATPKGEPDIVTDVLGTVLYNNDGEQVAMQYNANQSFITKISNSLDKASLIQVVNTHATNGITVTIRCSLDKVNWAPLPTAISADAITAGATKLYNINEAMYEAWLRIDVVVTSGATFYVIAK